MDVLPGKNFPSRRILTFFVVLQAFYASKAFCSDRESIFCYSLPALIMSISLNMTELAIFSIDRFIFCVEIRQIQEILTVKPSDFPGKPDPALPFWVLQYRQQPLPVFDLRRQFCLSPLPVDVLQQSFPSPLITFYAAGLLAACCVTSVEDIITISLGSLKSVPAFLTKIAYKNHVWGFYEISGTLLPLIDLDRVISSQDIALYMAFLSGLYGEPGSKRKF